MNEKRARVLTKKITAQILDDSFMEGRRVGLLGAYRKELDNAERNGWAWDNRDWIMHFK